MSGTRLLAAAAPLLSAWPAQAAVDPSMSSSGDAAVVAVLGVVVAAAWQLVGRRVRPAVAYARARRSAAPRGNPSGRRY
jgi:hypothetical protein